MAAAFSSIRISASLTANYRQIGIPAAKGIMVNSHPRRTCIPAMAMGMTKSNRHDHDSSINNSREVADIPQERDFTGTPYIPIYVTLPVYFDLMRSFRMVFNEFFENGSISQIEIGLGPRGELRYPSHSAKFGWKYPGIGEFQCYDKYLFKSLQKAAETWGASSFDKGSENTGSINSIPQNTEFFNTEFFHDDGEYISFYGSFFSRWYFQVLIDHADQVLGLAHLAFRGIPIAAKLPGIHWWRNTNSHAAELTAGFYYRCYSQVASMLKRRESTLNFACFEVRTRDEEREFLKALADPKIPVLIAAWDADIPAAGENARTIYRREGYNRILENAKPLGDPSCRCRLSVCNYLRLGPTLLEKHNFMEFERFVRKMHGGHPFN
ncbi:Beta-amylase 2, chloroplastic [Capsicum chinense]|nr:Beta-amylase 2, chloroplastic [Capsicum chinense]